MADHDAVLRARFGEPQKDYCTAVCNGPPPAVHQRYIVYVPRALAREAFERGDEARRQHDRALEKARQFFDDLPR